MAANLFVVLPTLAGNGSGAAVDTSGMGESKTITVGSGGGVYQPIVLIEVALDAAGANWSPLCSFQGKSEKTVQVACRWMRATTSRFVDGIAPVVSVGATDDGAQFATLPATAATGFGAGVDTSSMGLFKTIQVTSAFRGVLNVQASEDSGVTYTTVASLINPGQVSMVFAADHMRVHRDGVPLVGAGLPVITIAGSVLGGGGSGNAEDFTYVATGAEGSDFMVNLPVARSNDIYNVIPALQGTTFIFGIDCPDILAGDRTTTQFRVVTTYPLTAGDRITFEVRDPT